MLRGPSLAHQLVPNLPRSHAPRATHLLYSGSFLDNHEGCVSWGETARVIVVLECCESHLFCTLGSSSGRNNRSWTASLLTLGRAAFWLFCAWQHSASVSHHVERVCPELDESLHRAFECLVLGNVPHWSKTTRQLLYHSACQCEAGQLHVGAAGSRGLCALCFCASAMGGLSQCDPPATLGRRNRHMFESLLCDVWTPWPPLRLLVLHEWLSRRYRVAHDATGCRASGAWCARRRIGSFSGGFAHGLKNARRCRSCDSIPLFCRVDRAF